MKYYYEYKEKNGAKVGGHNLLKIELTDKYIKLMCIDIINNEPHYFVTILDMTKIEYFAIMPMEEEK